MFDIKTIVTALVVSVLVVFGAGLVGGNQSDELGAVTRMPNVDFVSRNLIASTTVTTATGTVFITSKSTTQGGEVVVRDADGSGCSAIGASNGTVVSRTITCPSF